MRSVLARVPQRDGHEDGPGRVLAADTGEEQIDRRVAEAVWIEVGGSDRHRALAALRGVHRGRDEQVARDVEPARARGGHDPRGDALDHADDGVRRLREVQQRRCLRVQELGGVVLGAPRAVGRDGLDGPGHRPGGRDERDPPRPGGREVVEDEAHRPRVVGVRVPVEVRALGIGLDRHDRHAVLGEEVELRVGGPRVADDRAVDAEVGQLGAGAHGRGDEQPVLARERGARRASGEAHVVLEARLAAPVVGGIDRGQDERERRGARGAQRPRGPARPVAHPLGDLADARGGGDADRPAPVQRQGHRRGRHAGGSGHVADRRAHGLHPRHGTAGTRWHRGRTRWR